MTRAGHCACAGFFVSNYRAICTIAQRYRTEGCGKNATLQVLLRKNNSYGKTFYLS
jgi:hypothetical protein